MAQVINTNTMSLNAQRNLSTSGSSLATTIQRLSSGSRINSAKDDAAGLAISERFGTQIRGTDVAIRNANDGISLAQVAEGSLSEIGNNLQRIRELSVQSANATNSSSDRKALQAEVTQLVSEIDRVAKQSEFNGTKLLDGSFSSQLFQVGANAGQAIAIDKVVNAKSAALGSTTFATAGEITISDTSASLATGKIAAGAQVGDVALGAIEYKVVTAADPDDDDAVAAALAETKANAATAMTTAINAKIGETGLHASSKEGVITLTAVRDDVSVASMAITGLVSDDELTNVADGTEAVTLDKLNIESVEGAQQALEIVDNALDSINNTRADLGAIQNRFTSVVANLQTST
ncbi:flagellin, partial [Stenotrophomonas cyclobalanopsidis]|uniref:flagellin n=1 Tax=Stenotrophomonas cyclobalanopsidis TaxID=2771362 RepID=UPI002FD9FD98